MLEIQKSARDDLIWSPILVEAGWVADARVNNLSPCNITQGVTRNARGGDEYSRLSKEEAEFGIMKD